jgi:hypothetical protein
MRDRRLSKCAMRNTVTGTGAHPDRGPAPAVPKEQSGEYSGTTRRQVQSRGRKSLDGLIPDKNDPISRYIVRFFIPYPDRSCRISVDPESNGASAYLTRHRQRREWGPKDAIPAGNTKRKNS